MNSFNYTAKTILKIFWNVLCRFLVDQIVCHLTTLTAEECAKLNSNSITNGQQQKEKLQQMHLASSRVIPSLHSFTSHIA